MSASENLNPVDLLAIDGLPVVEEVKPVEPVEPAVDGEDKPEAEKPEGESDEMVIDPEFAELREQMVNKGVDFTEMDELFLSGQPLKDEHIKLISEHSGYKENEVRSHIKLKQENLAFKKEQQVRADEAGKAYLAEIDSLAGGSYAQLQDYIMKNTPEGKLNIWSSALQGAKGKPDVVKSIVSEMVEYRESKLGKKPENANLDLLTKSNNSNRAASPAQSQVNSLEGNPVANESLQVLSSIKLAGSTHPLYENAMKVLAVRAPYLI
jgi:hypothetical protein